MSEWEPYPQEEHDAIVDNLRRQGWDRHDANEEADRLMAERIKRRKGGQELNRRLNNALNNLQEWQHRAEKAEAEVERLRIVLSLAVRADDLREAYHSLPNDRNRIGDKRSRKSHARDAWLRAFRKAAKEARASLQRKEGNE